MNMNNDPKNTHITFEFELELISVLQHRMAKKLSMNRELGDNPGYHAALNQIEKAAIDIRQTWFDQKGEWPKKHL